MTKIMIIGAGGVGNVVVQKCAQLPETFTDIVLASRTLAKCEKIAKSVKKKQAKQLNPCKLMLIMCLNLVRY